MILKFTLFSALFIAIVISIFKIVNSAVCNDSALYSMNKISLRQTLNKENSLSKFNDRVDRVNLKCRYYIKGKERLSLSRYRKKNIQFTMNLKTSITNE